MRKGRGFTLFELMIVVAVATLLSAMAAPDLTHFVARQEVAGVAHQTWHHINTARQLAIQTSSRATFCGLDRSDHCSRDSIVRFAVFVDQDYDQQLDAGERLEAAFVPDYSGQIAYRAGRSFTHVTFNADGSSRQAGRIVFCAPDSDPALTRKISFTLAGRSYITHPPAAETPCPHP